MGENISFQIKKYEDSDEIMWNKFLLKCKNSHFMFNRDFMEYHSDRFEDFSLIFKNNEEKIMALLPGNIKDNIFYSHQGLTFGGFLIDRGVHAADMLEIFTQLKIFLKEKILKKSYINVSRVFIIIIQHKKTYMLYLEIMQIFIVEILAFVLI